MQPFNWYVGVAQEFLYQQLQRSIFWAVQRFKVKMR